MKRVTPSLPHAAAKKSNKRAKKQKCASDSCCDVYRAKKAQSVDSEHGFLNGILHPLKIEDFLLNTWR